MQTFFFSVFCFCMGCVCAIRVNTFGCVNTKPQCEVTAEVSMGFNVEFFSSNVFTSTALFIKDPLRPTLVAIIVASTRWRN